MIFAVVLYFLLATAALALVLLPGARTHAAGWTRRMVRNGATVRRSIAGRGYHGTHGVLRALRVQSAQAREWLAPFRRWIAATVALLIAAPLLPLGLSGFLELEGYDHRLSLEVNQHIAALLRGEQLVAPPPVAPAWFTTREVEQARPLIQAASRQWELLDAEFRQRLLVVFELMRERHGIEMVLLEGYRSPQRQQQLAGLGPQTTRAVAFESWHQYGLAADCAFVRNGRIVISERDPWAAAAYAQYGEVARSVGLTWGGAWRKLKDYGHVELPRAGVMTRRSGAQETVAAHGH